MAKRRATGGRGSRGRARAPTASLRGGGTTALQTGAIFAKLTANSESTIKAIAVARRIVLDLARTIKRSLAGTGLRTAQVDTRGFERGMAELAKVYDQKLLRRKLKPLAQAIVAEAINSPIPRDTGALAESGFVEDGRRPGEVVFGFNRPYASIQDLGGRNLPPKPYGSPIGPNFYFSRTLARAAPGVYELIATLVREDLRRLSARRAGGRRR